MFNDPLFDWLIGFRIYWWFYFFLGGIFFIVINVILTHFYGGKTLVKKFLKDKVALSWGFLVLGLTAALYIRTSEYLTNTIADLNNNGFDPGNSLHPFFIFLNNNFNNIFIPISLIITVWNSNRYVRHNRGVFFRKFSQLEGLIFNVILTLMMFRMVINWLAVLIMSYTFLSQPLIPQKIIHPDGLYGLAPFGDLLSSFIGLATILSCLSLLVYFRERDAAYQKNYIYFTISGLVLAFSFMFILLPGFNNSLANIREAELKNITDLLVDSPSSSSSDLTVTLLRYQIVSDLPEVFPLPAWLTFLAFSRIILLFVEVYLFLSGSLKLPKLPEAGDRIIKRILDLS